MIDRRLRLSPFQFLAGFLFLLFAATPLHAFSDLLVGALVDDGVVALSRGGMEKLPREQEFLDFGAPLFLDSKGKYRIETGYENQPAVRIYNGRWEGSRADSERLDTAVAAPFSLLDGALKGSVAAGYGFDSFTLKAQNAVEETFIRADQKKESVRGGLTFKAFERLSAGISIIDTNYRSAPEIPFEIEVAATSWLKVGYKRSYSDFAANLDLNILGHAGNLPLELLETQYQYYGVVDYRALHLKYMQDKDDSENSSVEARLSLPGSLYLVGDYARRDHGSIDEQLSVDGKPGGTVKLSSSKKEYRLGAGGQLSSRWSVEANYRHTEVALDGGGIANTNAVVGFWPSLLVGNYNYIAAARLAADQYHVAGEYRGEQFSFTLGGQYLDIRPSARIDYWRSLIFGLGRAGEETKQLSVNRIEMLFLSAGIGYKYRNLGLNYAFGQFVPIKVHKSDDEAEPTPEPVGDSGSDRDFFTELADRLKHYPGGGMHRVMLSVVF